MANMSRGSVKEYAEAPGFSGDPRVKALKEASPLTAIVGLARKIRLRCLSEAMEAGLSGCLLKHARPQEILLAVRTAYEGEAVMDASVLKYMHFGVADRVPGNGAGGNGCSVNARELQVLRLSSEGLPTKEMAKHLGLSQRTVQAILGDSFRKLGVKSRTEAIVYALRISLL